jgi:hypothetical protein
MERDPPSGERELLLDKIRDDGGDDPPPRDGPATECGHRPETGQDISKLSAVPSRGGPATTGKCGPGGPGEDGGSEMPAGTLEPGLGAAPPAEDEQPHEPLSITCAISSEQVPPSGARVPTLEKTSLDFLIRAAAGADPPPRDGPATECGHRPETGQDISKPSAVPSRGRPVTTGKCGPGGPGEDGGSEMPAGTLEPGLGAAPPAEDEQPHEPLSITCAISSEQVPPSGARVPTTLEKTSLDFLICDDAGADPPPRDGPATECGHRPETGQDISKPSAIPSRGGPATTGKCGPGGPGEDGGSEMPAGTLEPGLGASWPIHMQVNELRQQMAELKEQNTALSKTTSELQKQIALLVWQGSLKGSTRPLSSPQAAASGILEQILTQQHTSSPMEISALLPSRDTLDSSPRTKGATAQQTKEAGTDQTQGRDCLNGAQPEDEPQPCMMMRPPVRPPPRPPPPPVPMEELLPPESIVASAQQQEGQVTAAHEQLPTTTGKRQVDDSIKMFLQEQSTADHDEAVSTEGVSKQCEQCNERLPLDHSYGSGRFCDVTCRNTFNSSATKRKHLSRDLPIEQQVDQEQLALPGAQSARKARQDQRITKQYDSEQSADAVPTEPQYNKGDRVCVSGKVFADSFPDSKFYGQIIRIFRDGRARPFKISFDDGETHSVSATNMEKVVSFTVQTSECAICREDLLSDPRGLICKLSCGHAWHSTCIQNWSNQTNGVGLSCPICRGTSSGLRRCQTTTAQFVNLSTDDLQTVASTTQMHTEDSAGNALQSKPEQQQANRATLKLKPVLCRMSDSNGDWERFETAGDMAAAKGVDVNKVIAIAAKICPGGRDRPPTKVGGGGHWSKPGWNVKFVDDDEEGSSNAAFAADIYSCQDADQDPARVMLEDGQMGNFLSCGNGWCKVQLCSSGVIVNRRLSAPARVTDGTCGTADVQGDTESRSVLEGHRSRLFIKTFKNKAVLCRMSDSEGAWERYETAESMAKAKGVSLEQVIQVAAKLIANGLKTPPTKVDAASCSNAGWEVKFEEDVDGQCDNVVTGSREIASASSILAAESPSSSPDNMKLLCVAARNTEMRQKALDFDDDAPIAKLQRLSTGQIATTSAGPAESSIDYAQVGNDMEPMSEIDDDDEVEARRGIKRSQNVKNAARSVRVSKRPKRTQISTDGLSNEQLEMIETAVSVTGCSSDDALNKLQEVHWGIDVAVNRLLNRRTSKVTQHFSPSENVPVTILSRRKMPNDSFVQNSSPDVHSSAPSNTIQAPARQQQIGLSVAVSDQAAAPAALTRVPLKLKPVLCRMSDCDGAWERFETAEDMAAAKGVRVARVVAIAAKLSINGRSQPPTKVGCAGGCTTPGWNVKFADDEGQDPQPIVMEQPMMMAQPTVESVVPQSSQVESFESDSAKWTEGDQPILKLKPVLCRMSDCDGAWERFETAEDMAKAKGIERGADKIISIAAKLCYGGRPRPPTKVGGGGHWSKPGWNVKFADESTDDIVLAPQLAQAQQQISQPAAALSSTTAQLTVKRVYAHQQSRLPTNTPDPTDETAPAENQIDVSEPNWPPMEWVPGYTCDILSR